jgi:hypothetical protein
MRDHPLFKERKSRIWIGWTGQRLERNPGAIQIKAALLYSEAGAELEDVFRAIEVREEPYWSDTRPVRVHWSIRRSIGSGDVQDAYARELRQRTEAAPALV